VWKYVALGARMGGVVANHQDVDFSLRGQFSRQLAVMARYGYRSHPGIRPQLGEFVPHT
jgi:hypothetical protein